MNGRDITALALREYSRMQRAIASKEPRRVLAAQAESYANLTTLTNRLISDLPDNAKPECGPGCAYCCHQQVGVTVPEAALWGIWMRKQGAKVALDVCETANRISKGDLTSYCAKKIPCAALIGPEDQPTHKRSCAAYAVRPIACRSVFSPAAGVCKRNFGDPEAIALNVMPPRAAAGMFGFALMCAIDGFGLLRGNLDLHMAGSRFALDPHTLSDWLLRGEDVCQKAHTGILLPFEAMRAWRKFAAKGEKSLWTNAREWMPSYDNAATVGGPE